jgi:hypothetical protein
MRVPSAREFYQHSGGKYNGKSVNWDERDAIPSSVNFCAGAGSKHSIQSPWNEIGELLNTISATECANDFASSGRVYT